MMTQQTVLAMLIDGWVLVSCPLSLTAWATKGEERVSVRHETVCALSRKNLIRRRHRRGKFVWTIRPRGREVVNG